MNIELEKFADESRSAPCSGVDHVNDARLRRRRQLPIFRKVGEPRTDWKTKDFDLFLRHAGAADNSRALFVGDQDAVLQEVESFISNSGRTADVDSVLGTVLYIATIAKTKGDGSDAGRFNVLAKREVQWFKGRVSEANDTEFSAIFDGPIRAIRCARAIRDSALELGIETKAGLHTGLCEMRGDHASGAAVEISRRVADRAAAGEVLLTNTVTDLVSGSEIVFSNRGACNFEGLLKDCRLSATV